MIKMFLEKTVGSAYYLFKSSPPPFFNQNILSEQLSIIKQKTD